MDRVEQDAKVFQTLLAKSPRITVLSHINPDPDAIGTALGIYLWLKEQGYTVEVVNATEEIPRFLDFLPSFSKIKSKMDFEDSLIIACDCGSVDRLGFSVEGRDIINIDHHMTNSGFGLLNVVDTEAVSSSEVAYRLLKKLHSVSRESAVAFYAALVSDTRNFTTNTMCRDTFDLASELVSLGVDISEVSSQMLHRRSLASLRILGIAIESLVLQENGQIALFCITQEDLRCTGAKQSDLDGVVDYAKSLATVEIAIMLVERETEIKVSVRSKQIDITALVIAFGGGGHITAGGFECKETNMAVLSQQIIDEIKKRGLLG